MNQYAPRDPETKARALALYADNHPVREIARILDLPKSTVYNWLNQPNQASDPQPDLKAHAIRLRQAKHPVREIARILNTPLSTVYMWTARTTELPTMAQYDTDLKRRALALKAENYSVRAIAKKIAVPEQTVYAWMRQTRERSVTLLAQCQESLNSLTDALAAATPDNPLDPAALAHTVHGIAKRLAAARAGLNI